MALAVTHIIGTIFILDLLRHYVFGKRKFPRYLLVIGGIAALFPDIDVPIGWLLSFMQGAEVIIHGLFTHSLLFPLLFLIIGIILHYAKNNKWAKISYVIAAGLLSHIIFDCLFNSYATFLWPLKINTLTFCPKGIAAAYRTGIDAIILVVWLVHEEIHNNIRDYI
jgi:membrane-bound metal-dependent hydrolase YbcI (DUF457 family)